MRTAVTFDTRDLKKFEETCKRLDEKTALKAAKKAAQKGANIVGKAIRSAAPVGETGQLRKGFRKKMEHSRLRGKFVYDYAMDPAKNAIFQKPIRYPGTLGGKNKHAYYPSSIEYGFLARAPGAGYVFTPGQRLPSQKIEGTHFTRKAAEESAPAVYAEVSRVLNEELDKEWAK